MRNFLRLNAMALLWGIGIGLLPLFAFGVYSHVAQTRRDACLTQYRYTSSSLDCAQYEESSDRLKALDAKFEAATAAYVREGKAQKVSVWVRDLESKQYAASNENTNYALFLP